MTAIASYFAQVGIGLDQNALNKVDSYLDRVEKSLQRFQGKMSRKSSLELRFRVDQAKLNTNIQAAMKQASRSGAVALDVGKFNFKSGSLISAINREFKLASQANRGVKIDARLSEGSLRAMRTQIQSSMKGLIISPTINANVVSRTRARIGSGEGGEVRRGGYDVIRRQNPTSSRNMSPYYNPMMIGGGVGAVMRYGAYALPLYAGAIGFNSASNKAQTLQSQDLMMKVSTQDPAEAAKQIEYLNKLGNYLGITTETMAPFYGQLYAGSKGTPMEDTLQDGFKKFLEYSSVVGLDAEQQKGALRAISQMIAKRTVMSEELRQQLAEHGMPMAVQIMADAVAGGDIAKLQKMMERGEVKSLEALPKFFDELGRLAAPFIKDYFDTIKYSKGNLAKISEDWFKRFMEAGGTSGTTNIYDSLADFSKALGTSSENAGKIFKSASDWFNVGILTFRDLGLWLTGRDIGIENIFETYLGKFDTTIWTTISTTLGQIAGALGNAVEFLGSIYKVLDEIGVIATAWATAKNLITTVGNVASAAGAIVKPELGAMANEGQRRRAEEEAEALVRKEEASGKKYTPEQRADRIERLKAASLNYQVKNRQGMGWFDSWMNTISDEWFVFDRMLVPHGEAFGKDGKFVNIPIEQITANPELYPDLVQQLRDRVSKPYDPRNSAEWLTTKKALDEMDARERGVGYFNDLLGNSPKSSMFGTPSSSDLLTPMFVDSLGGILDKVSTTNDNLMSIISSRNSRMGDSGTKIDSITVNVTIEDPIDPEQMVEFVVNEFGNQFSNKVGQTMTNYNALIT